LLAPLPFFLCSFFYVAESAAEDITAQIQKPALQHNAKCCCQAARKNLWLSYLLSKHARTSWHNTDQAQQSGEVFLALLRTVSLPKDADSKIG